MEPPTMGELEHLMSQWRVETHAAYAATFFQAQREIPGNAGVRLTTLQQQELRAAGPDETDRFMGRAAPALPLQVPEADQVIHHCLIPLTGISSGQNKPSCSGIWLISTPKTPRSSFVVSQPAPTVCRRDSSLCCTGSALVEDPFRNIIIIWQQFHIRYLAEEWIIFIITPGGAPANLSESLQQKQLHNPATVAALLYWHWATLKQTPRESATPLSACMHMSIHLVHQPTPLQTNGNALFDNFT
ncbi:hypothetical protein CBL_11326 [Carabus blaptoides fortunei]